MRVICAPGRLVLHPQTRRRIDGETGIPYDPNDFAIAQLIAHEDLLLVDDEAAAAAEGSSVPQVEADHQAEPAALEKE